AAVQHDRAAVAAPDRPGGTIRKRDFPLRTLHNQVRVELGSSHVVFHCSKHDSSDDYDQSASLDEAAGYNRSVRSSFALFFLLSLAACNRGIQSKEAVREGVIDYLSKRTDLSMRGMTVDVDHVKFEGNRAEAQVTFLPKGGPPGGGMTMRYTMERKD